MRRLVAALLVICLLWSGDALAERQKVYDIPAEDQALLNARFDELLEMTAIGEAYPACCAGMSDTDRLLFVAILYCDALNSSQGLCGFMLDDPAMISDVPAALYMLGAREHADALAGFCDAGMIRSMSVLRHFGSLGYTVACSLHDFAGFDATAAESGWRDSLPADIVRFLRESDSH